MAIQVLDSPQGLHLEAPCNTLRCAERLPETKWRDSNGAGWIMIELQEMNFRRIFTCHDWLIPFGITENWGFPTKIGGTLVILQSSWMTMTTSIEIHGDLGYTQ
jgi:hypothetical protein